MSERHDRYRLRLTLEAVIVDGHVSWESELSTSACSKEQDVRPVEAILIGAARKSLADWGREAEARERRRET